MRTDVNQIQPGWEIIGSDGEKVGDATDVGRDYVMLTKGLIFLKDLYVPFDAIADIDPDRQSAYLDVPKDQVESMGWDEPPAESMTDTGARVEGSSDRAWGSTDRAATTDEGETLRVPVHQEELQTQKRSQRAGEVQVDKKVVEDEREMDVPVTREEVQIRRVGVDRAATGDEQPFTDGDTIRVPVTAEQVEVSKQPRVVEEIEVTKRPVTETQRVGGTVRREEVEIREEGDVRAVDDERELAGAGAGSASRATRDRDWQDPATTGMRSADLDDDAGTLTDDESLSNR